jgi:hypothetical protein
LREKWNSPLRRNGFCCAVFSAVIFCASPSSASEPELKVIGSSTVRFTLTGRNPAVLLSLAGWADSVARRVETATGIQMGFGAYRSFFIVVHDLPDSARVLRTERFARGRLTQKLVLEDFNNTRWEDALEEFSKLLVNGYAITPQIGKVRTVRTSHVPEWISIGLIHWLDQGIRVRNKRMIIELDDENSIPSIRTVLSWKLMPDGALREKAVAASAMAWLLSSKNKTAVMEAIFRRMGEGEEITADWLVTVLPDCDSEEKLEQIWKTWIERERRAVTGLGELSSLWTEKLKASVIAVAGRNGVPKDAGAQQGGRIVPDRMISIKKEDWVPRFCDVKVAELKILSLGRPAEFVAVSDRYCKFFNALGKRRRDATLKKLLTKAIRGFESLSGMVKARDRYIDDIEARFERGEFTPAAPEPAHTALEPTDGQRYIERKERPIDRDAAAIAREMDDLKKLLE